MVLIITNLLVVFFNNSELFKNYNLKINFISSENQIEIFETYKYTILSKIKKNLGNEYKFRNYKITGPYSSKIEFYRQSFKNKQKTDYIKSKTFVTFSISSNDKQNLSFIKNQIIKNYPKHMNDLNNFKLFNFFKVLGDRIIFLCQKDFFSFTNKKNLCKKLYNQYNSSTSILNDIDLFNSSKQYLSQNSIQKVEQIKVLFFEIKKLIENESQLFKKNYYYTEEIINIIEELELASNEKIISFNNMEMNPIKYSFEVTNIIEVSFFNKVLVYLNLILLLIIFTLFYLKNVFENKAHN